MIPFILMDMGLYSGLGRWGTIQKKTIEEEIPDYFLISYASTATAVNSFVLVK